MGLGEEVWKGKAEAEGTHEYWVLQAVLLRGVVRRCWREEGSGEVVLARSGGEARNEAAVSSEGGNRMPVPSRYANAC